MNIKLIFVPEYLFTDKKDILNSILLHLEKSLVIGTKSLLNSFNVEKKENTLSLSELKDIMDCTNFVHYYLTGNKESFFMEQKATNATHFTGKMGDMDSNPYKVIIDIPLFKGMLIDVLTGQPNTVEPSISNIKYKKDVRLDKFNNTTTFYLVNVNDKLAKYLYLNNNLEDKIDLFEMIVKFLTRMEVEKDLFKSNLFLDFLVRIKEMNKKGLPKENKVTIAVGV